jgi:flagellar biosynthetic protein FliQ
MNEMVLFDAMREALWISVKMSLPLLGVGLVVGLAIGLFQALTSIQEQTLTFAPKVGAMLLVFWVSMSFMTSTLLTFFNGSILPLIAGG